MKNGSARLFLTILASGLLVLVLLLPLFQSGPRHQRVALASVSLPATPAPLPFCPSRDLAEGGWRPAEAPPLTAPAPSGHKPREIRGTLLAGETLDALLVRLGLAADLRHRIVSGFQGVLDFKELRAGDTLTILLRPDGDLAVCTYCRSPLESYTLEKSALGWRAARDEIPLTCRTVRVSGTVHGGSLLKAFIAAGEGSRLAFAFADIFASRIDFNTEIAPGDRFDLLVEKYYKDRRFVGYGRILVGRFQPATGDPPLEAVYDKSDNTNGYFSLDGKSLGASFIRSPIPFARVSSGFSYHRLHPILGIVRPHLGVDLAAPTGTPVMAVADGTVRFIGVNGGFGNQIILDHAGGYRTFYGHLSRFRPGLEVGDRVRQKEVIGYVGATGLATGPHLDYRLEQMGEFLNPFAVRFSAAKELTGGDLARLRLHAEIYATFMKGAATSRVVAVRKLTLPADTRLALL